MVLTETFRAIRTRMAPAASLPIGTLQTWRVTGENTEISPTNNHLPFLRKLHGAFFALFAKTARCSGVNSYLCEYLHVDYVVATSVATVIEINRYAPP